jgi:hypothetical protein
VGFVEWLRLQEGREDWTGLYARLVQASPNAADEDFGPLVPLMRKRAVEEWRADR